ncbi:MAG: S49 family peptidase [Janthinobacterium lividum]
MSSYTARNALEDLVSRPSMVARDYAESGASPDHGGLLFADIRSLASADMEREQKLAAERRVETLSFYGLSMPEADADSKPFAFSNGLAIIPVHGLLINRFPYSWGFVTGYNFIRNQLQAAEADPDVTGIVFDVSSGGGSTNGLQETADAITAGKKPSMAVVDASAYSAAYWLASACDKISMTPSGGVGSIGTISMRLDVSEAMGKAGVKLNLFTAGAFKGDGWSATAMTKAEGERIQDIVDKTNAPFLAAVAANRKIPVATVAGFEAGCFYGQDALDSKLIDAIAIPSAAIENFFNDDPEDSLDSPPDGNEVDTPSAQTGQNTMTDEEIVAARQADVKAERDRSKGIMQHVESKGRETLASHLAYETSMSVDEAGKILAAAPKPAEPAKTTVIEAPAQPTAAGAPNALKTVMDKQGGAGVTPEAGSGGDAGNTGESTQAAKPEEVTVLARFREMHGGK